jgi:nitrous oxide reductase accessory protein NosL
MFIKIAITLLFIVNSSGADAIKKGEKIYSIMCDKEKISTLSNKSKVALKAEISSKNICGRLSHKNLEALLLFLTSKKEQPTLKPLLVPQKARCPVCGMFTAKYPKWAAMMQMKDGKQYYFDGVKDMMKFYFSPNQFHHDVAPIEKIVVTDYYTLEGIDAKKAYYVIGANVYGPMGEELIPFKTKADARYFQKEHHGKKVLTFDTIKESFLY